MFTVILITHKHRHSKAPSTQEQRCPHADTHSSSSTDANRHEHRWTHTGRCSRMQNKHTQGFGVLVSICGEAILSLWLLFHSQTPLVGEVSLWSCDTCCCCCSLCAGVCTCMCPSLLMCFYLMLWMVLSEYAQPAFICPSFICVCVCVCERGSSLLQNNSSPLYFYTTQAICSVVCD